MAAAAAALEPLVDALVAVHPDELSVEALQLQIALLHPQVDRLRGWLDTAAGALQAQSGGELPTPDGGRRTTVGWLGEVARTSSSAAGSALRTSTALRRLPHVVDAMLDGVLTPEQAAVLSRLVGRIGDDALTDAEAHLVAVARDRTPAELEHWVRHLIATHIEPQLEHDADRARRGRYLQTTRHPDGSVRGRFSLSPEQAETFLTVLEPLARSEGRADTRSAGQRRADALTEIAEQVLRHGDLPQTGGQRPQISYVLPADWAARQQDRAHCPTCSSCPTHRPQTFTDTVTASLPGQPGVPAEQACAVGAWTGPQTRGDVEALLCDARISRVLLDGFGQVRSLETLTDDVTPAQRRALAARDGGCTVRGCTRPPAMTDVHHLVRRADGGQHVLDNLVLLCRRHHVLWHLGALHLRQLHVPWHPESSRDWGDDFLAQIGPSSSAA